MEGRVHAQNDEFGHSRVDTHIPPWSAHMHALKHAHTHTHTEKQQQMFQCPDHWTGEACQSQQCWYDYSLSTLTKCCWRPCDCLRS